MAADFTKKEISDAMESLNRGDPLPENSVFQPWAETRGGPILRRMTPEEMHAAGVKPSESKDKEG